MKVTQEFFKITDEFEVFISDIVLLEIEEASEQKKELLLSVIKNHKIKALESSEKIEILADMYINQGIIPKKFYNDALHIALATKYKMDAIISWNLTYIVKFKTKFQVKAIN